MSRIVSIILLAAVIVAVGAFILFRDELILKSAGGVLGPDDTPDFQSMDWKEIKVSYWVFPEMSVSEEKTLLIDDENKISILRENFRVTNVGPYSLDAGDQIYITVGDGETWKGNIVFENTVYLCRSSDTYYSYTIELEDTSFYDGLRNLCAIELSKTYGSVSTKNVKLRSNTDNSRYTVLPKLGEK